VAIGEEPDGINTNFELTNSEMMTHQKFHARMVRSGDEINLKARTGTIDTCISFYKYLVPILPPVDDFGLPFSNLKYSGTVTNTNKTLTVPGFAKRYKAVFTTMSNQDIYISIQGVPTSLPGAGNIVKANCEVFTEDYPEAQHKSYCREVKAGDVINFISTSTGSNINVGIVFYAVG
jgi:hypothetical protein